MTIPADTRVSFCSRFACVAGVYLLGGVIYQRVTSGAKGIDQIPNLGFWLNLGNMTAVSISGQWRFTAGEGNYLGIIAESEMTEEDISDGKLQSGHI